MIVKRYPDGRYSVIDANRFYVTQQPKDLAAEQLKAQGIDPDILDTLASPSEWRTTMSSAVVSTTQALTQAVESAASESDVAALRESTKDAVAALTQEILRLNNEQASRDEADAKAAEFERHKAIAAAHGMEGPDVDRAILRHLEAR